MIKNVFSLAKCIFIEKKVQIISFFCSEISLKHFCEHCYTLSFCYVHFIQKSLFTTWTHVWGNHFFWKFHLWIIKRTFKILWMNIHISADHMFVYAIFSKTVILLQIRLVNIRSDEIVDGNPKLTLGLVWTIILHFQVRFYKFVLKNMI